MALLPPLHLHRLGSTIGRGVLRHKVIFQYFLLTDIHVHCENTRYLSGCRWSGTPCQVQAATFARNICVQSVKIDEATQVK
jgi:hypothetical protein